MHSALWAGIVSGSSGAPQFGSWQAVEKGDLYGQFKSVGEFTRQSGLLSKKGLLAASVGVESTEKDSLRVLGRSGKDFAALWISNKGTAETGGKVTLAGLQSGEYKATWWDTAAGKPLSEDSVTVLGANPAALTLPAVKQDVAVWISRANEKAAAKLDSGKKKGKAGG